MRRRFALSIVKSWIWGPPSTDELYVPDGAPVSLTGVNARNVDREHVVLRPLFSKAFAGSPGKKGLSSNLRHDVRSRALTYTSECPGSRPPALTWRPPANISALFEISVGANSASGVMCSMRCRGGARDQVVDPKPAASQRTRLSSKTHLCLCLGK